MAGPFSSIMTELIRLPYPVPYHAQLASAELAEAIFVHGLDPARDPCWAETGAASPEEYAYWAERACGVACLKMCLEALDGPVRPLVEWARIGVQRGAYRPQVGWIHGTLAEMARAAGFDAEAKTAEPMDIIDCLRRGQSVIASVSHEAGDERIAITKRGGHLMVVIGAELEEGIAQAFFVHNPSGRRKEWRANARVNFNRFQAGYSGRVIVISQPAPSERSA